ncbi:hypothetical protein IAU59_002754 [Kwoniella sp. CBS 9459]
MSTPPEVFTETEPEKDKVKTESSSPPEPAAPPTIDDTNRPYQFEDSDITLVSSDGLHFKIHSYHLMAASPVFRDMLTVGKGSSEQTVQLTDTKFETSSIVALFLQACYGPQVFFILACALDDVNLIQSIVRRAGHWGFIGYTEPEPTGDVEKQAFRALRNIPYCSCLDLTAIKFTEFDKIPNDIKFALLRATHDGKSLFNYKAAEWVKIADSFEIILKSIRKSHLKLL